MSLLQSRHRLLAGALAAACLTSTIAVQQAAPTAALEQSVSTTDSTIDVGPVEELTTATSNTVRNADGSYTLSAASAPINYQDEAGNWAPIDTTLEEAPGSTYAAQTADTGFVAKIPANGSEAPVRLEDQGEWISMKMHGLDDAPEIEGSEATFTDVEGASEVTYTAVAAGLKENIVLNSRPGSAPTYTYTLRASSGLRPVLTPEQTVELRRDNGETAFVIPRGNMTDSSTDAAYSEAVQYGLTESGNGWTLSVTPDADWLGAAERVYPVTIDPTVYTFADISSDCYLRMHEPTASACGTDYLRVGRKNTSEVFRSLLKFDTSTVPTNAILNTAPRVAMYMDASLSYSSASAVYGLALAGKKWGASPTWNNSQLNGAWEGGSPGGTPQGNTLTLTGDNSGWKIFTGTTLTNTIEAAIESPGSLNGFVLRQFELGNNVLLFRSANNTAGANPKLDFTYTVPSRPNTPHTLSATSGGLLKATVSDPDGGYVGARFIVKKGATTIWSGASPLVSTTPVPAGSPSTYAGGGVAQVVVPADYLTDQEQYSVSVTSWDGGLASANSATTSFTFAESAAGSTAPYTAISETRILGPSVIPANKTVTLPLNPISVSWDQIDELNTVVQASGWSSGTAGSLRVQTPQGTDPAASTIAWTASDSPATPVVRSRALAPNGDNTLTIRNPSTSAVTLTIDATGWFELAADPSTVEDLMDGNLDEEIAEVEQDELGDTFTASTSDGAPGPSTFAATASPSAGEQTCDDEYVASNGQDMIDNLEPSEDPENVVFICAIDAEEDPNAPMEWVPEDAPGGSGEGNTTDGDDGSSGDVNASSGGAALMSTSAASGQASNFKSCQTSRSASNWNSKRFVTCSKRRRVYNHYKQDWRGKWYVAGTTTVDWVRSVSLDRLNLIMTARMRPEYVTCSLVGCGGIRVEYSMDCEPSCGTKVEWSDLMAPGEYGYELKKDYAAPLQGTEVSKDFRITATTRPSCGGRPGCTGSTGLRVEDPSRILRCDNFSYFRQGAGCAIPAYEPILKLGLNNPKYKDSAAYIKQIQNAYDWAKVGQKDKALHYTNVANRKKNRYAACRGKKGIYRKSCDEFPFASTLEGCFTGPPPGTSAVDRIRWCDTADVTKSHNSAAGSKYGGFLRRNRLQRDRSDDEFYVSVLP